MLPNNNILMSVSDDWYQMTLNDTMSSPHF